MRRLDRGARKCVRCSGSYAMSTALCIVAFGNIWLQTQWHSKSGHAPIATSATNIATLDVVDRKSAKRHSSQDASEGHSGEKPSDDMLLEEVLEEPLITDLPVHTGVNGSVGAPMKISGTAVPWTCGRVLLTHEYVPYPNHHGADTRLLDVLASLDAIGCEVRYVAYATLLGSSNTHAWEQPKAPHISAVEALGASVDRQPCDDGTTSSGLLSSTNPASVSKPLMNCLRKRLRIHQPHIVLCTLWFWTWPLRPHWASLVADAVATMDVIDGEDDHDGNMQESSSLFLHRNSTKAQAHCRLVILSDDVHGDREATRPGATTAGGGRDKNTVTSLRGSGKKEVNSAQALLAASPERTENVRTMELNVYQSADTVLAITASDRASMRVLLHELPSSFPAPVNEPLQDGSSAIATSSAIERDFRSRVYTVPPTASLPHATAEAAWRRKTFEERNGFLFVGTGQNPTNVAAVAWLLVEVWPFLRKQLRAGGLVSTNDNSGGGAHLTLVGAQPPGGSWHSSIATLAQQQALGVRVLGFVKDLEPLLTQARVILSPVRVASGFNTKNLLALSHALPLVATRAAAAGLPLGAAAEVPAPTGNGGNKGAGASRRSRSSGSRPGNSEAEAFAGVAAHLHRNATAWAAQGRAGLMAAHAAFSPAAVANSLAVALRSTATVQLLDHYSH